MLHDAATLTRLEARLLLREPLGMVFTVAFPLILLFLLLAAFDDQTATEFTGLTAPDYYVPAYLAGVAAAAGLIGLPVHLAGYLDSGVLRRFRASGVRPVVLISAQVMVNAVLAAISGALLIALGGAAYTLSAPASWPATIAAFALVTIAFTTAGTALAAFVPQPRAVQGLGMLLFFGMFFVAGGGPPEPLLPDAVVNVAQFMPLFHAASLLRDVWTGAALDLTAVAVMVGLAVIATVLASARLRHS